MANLFHKEWIEWLEFWIEEANVERYPRVLLIGDSITKSYFEPVSKALFEKAACAKLTSSKCVGDPTLQDMLSLLLNEFLFSIIHFNNGLHGMDNTDDFYRENFPKVLDWIRSLAPGAKIIWANTTPWRCKGNCKVLGPNNTRVILRNQIAQEYAQAHGIPINDLYGLLIDHPEYYDDDGVHLRVAGVQVAAENTVAIILKSLKECQ